MSNRDGKRADKSQKYSKGSPCPNCTPKRKAAGKSITRLEKYPCGREHGHKHHVHCKTCNYANF